MSDAYLLKFGGATLNFRKSETQIAVRAQRGRAQFSEFALEALGRRQPAERRGRLGRFELVDMASSKEAISHERLHLERTTGIDRVTTVYHTSDDGVPFVPEGPLFLRFHSGVGADAQSQVFERHGLTILRALPQGRFKVARLTSDDPLEIAAQLQKEAVVDVAEPDLVTYRELLSLPPDDGRFQRQWHLHNDGQIDGVSSGLVAGADVRVVNAWKLLSTNQSNDPVIGMIDDGFDLSHPDIVGKAVQPLDILSGTQNVSPQPHPNDPSGGGDWHGTPCAGLAVGRFDGGDIVGVAPNARLMPVRMDPDLSPASVVRCFDHMTENGAWVVSCSWKAMARNYPLPTEVAEAIARCASKGRDGKGAVIVFAAGNRPDDINDTAKGTVNGYAAHPDVLAVSGSTSRDTAWDSSALGREIAVCAPSGGGLGARNIVTSDVSGTYVDAFGIERRLGYVSEDYYDQFSGTSASCPLVAGVAALVLDANPQLNASDVREIVRLTARKIGPGEAYENGHSRRYGHGCVDAGEAVARALELRPDGEILVAAR